MRVEYATKRLRRGYMTFYVRDKDPEKIRRYDVPTEDAFGWRANPDRYLVGVELRREKV